MEYGPASRTAAFLLGSWLLLAVTPAATQEQFESPPTFRASEILPDELLSGPNHRVDERVLNDGFMNIYTIESRFGTFTATSGEQLRIRIDEVDGIARMDEWSESEQFREGLTKEARDLLDSGRQLLKDPGGSLRATSSGVLEVFASARRRLTEGDEATEGSDIGETVVDLVGYSRARRQYAAQFGVDPYSTNPVVQAYLNHLSRVGFAGQAVGRATRSLVDGGVGTAVSVASYLHSLEEEVRDKTPTELREVNLQKLQAMGVEQSVIDLFLGNYVFTPTYQTAFVDLLSMMEGAARRGEFVKMAVLAKNEDQALFRIGQARMYVDYHESVAPIGEFELISELIIVAARTQGGALVVNVPADYVAYTENLAAYFTAARSGLDDVAGVTQKQLWLAGGMSATARAWIEESGWVVRTDTLDRKRPSAEGPTGESCDGPSTSAHDQGC